MNIYEIIAFSCGQSRKVIVQSYDIVSAINCSGENMFDVVSCKLIDSADVTNNAN